MPSPFKPQLLESRYSFTTRVPVWEGVSPPGARLRSQKTHPEGAQTPGAERGDPNAES